MDKITIQDLLTHTVWFYGMCPSCHEIHGDFERTLSYFDWLERLHIITIDHDGDANTL
jgi:hypothetical protein